MKKTVILIACLCAVFVSIVGLAAMINQAPVSIEHTHVWGAWRLEKQATCMEDGVERRVCSCGEDQVSVRPASGHRFNDKALCASSRYCTVCGFRPGATAEHTVVIDQAVSATCATPGLTEGQHCSACNEVIIAQQPIAQKQHAEVVYAAVAPTCETSGSTRKVVCTECNQILEEPQVIFATGHTVVVVPGVPATCTTDGYSDEKYCSVCDKTLAEKRHIPATGHTLGQWNMVSGSICEHNGTRYNVCADCGELLVEEVVKNESDWIVVSQQTCTTTGQRYKECTVCAKKLYEEWRWPAGHSWVVDKGVAPTCTQSGLTEGRHCSVCNEVLLAQEVIPAPGHIDVEDKAVAPTCTETGLTIGRHCSACGKVFLKQETILAKGHTEAIDKGRDATCFLPGLSDGKHCSTCGMIIQPQTQIPPINHSFINRECQYCHVVIIGGYSEGLEFVSNGDGTCYVAGIGTCQDTELLIPEQSPAQELVIGIGAYAFASCKGLVLVTIPDTVVSIDKYAFYECHSLTQVNLSNSLVQIGEGAFFDCNKVEYISFPNSLSNIGVAAFSHCSKLTYITLPDSLKTIGDYAFYNCIGLISINIPKSLTSIGEGAYAGCLSVSNICVDWGNTTFYSTQNCVVERGTQWLVLGCNSSRIPDDIKGIAPYAFLECSGLTSVTLPRGLESIGVGAFYSCVNLTSITYKGSEEEWNEIEKWYDWDYNVPATVVFEIISKPEPQYGLIFVSNGDGTCYVGGMATYMGTEIMIPAFSPAGDRVIGIGRNAFFDCRDLISITIPNGVITIGEGAFSICTSLITITIPASVTSIGKTAFEDCLALENFIFQGTKAQWCGITKGEDWNKNIPAAVVHCTDGDLYLNAEVGSQGLIYMSNGDGTCYVSGIGTCTDTQIVIPSVTWMGERVTGIGDFVFYNYSKMTHVTIPDGVTSIGIAAFSGCTNLTNIQIPNSVTNISGGAFRDCRALNFITIPEGVRSIGAEAFSGCISVTQISISNTVTNIANRAFSNCISLGSITIPNSVTMIGSGVFEGCTSLHSITVPFVGETKDGVTKAYLGYLFGATSYILNTQYIPSSLDMVTITDSTIIPYRAFYGCSNLTSIIISKNVTAIGDEAFKQCAGLSKFTIPVNVTSIGDGAFEGCTGLFYIEIPANVAYIGEYAFKDCNRLMIVEMGNGLKTIAAYAFEGCNRLSEITIPSGVTYIGEYAFLNCITLTEISIPESVTYIGRAAFGECNNLLSITIPFVGETKDESTTNTYFGHIFGGYKNEGVLNSLKMVTIAGSTAIAADAFADCDQLAEIILSDKVTRIGEYAFFGCTSLTSVTFSADLQNIGKYAFSGCTSLTNITFNSTKAKWMNIKKDATWNYEVPATVVHCLDGDLSLAAALVPSVGLEFKWDGNGNYYVSGIGACTDSIIVIPTITPTGHRVAGIGERAFADCSNLVGIIIPDSVISICAGAFSNCQNLTSVTIGKNVSSIEKNIFSFCSSLTTIEVDEENITYYIDGNCIIEKNTRKLITGCKASVIPDNVTCIEENAFYGCSGLISVVIPNTVTQIGEYAFARCSDLETVTLSNQIEKICFMTFFKCTALTRIVIPDKVDHIAGSAFYGCTDLASVTLPQTLKNIVSDAFAECTGLNSITFKGTKAEWRAVSKGKGWNREVPATVVHCVDGDVSFNESIDEQGLVFISNGDGTCWLSEATYPSKTSVIIPSVSPVGDRVTGIGQNIFDDWNYVLNVTIPNTVTIIDDNAFSGCSRLLGVSLPNSVITIGSGAFLNCSNITALNIPDSVTSIGKSAFAGCTNLTTVMLPSGIKIIEQGLFDGCEKLRRITIPESVTVIGLGAFRSCQSLTEVTICGKITAIGAAAFADCSGLNSITIPNSVTNIGELAFASCTGLMTIIFQGAESQWNAIAKGQGWNIGVPGTVIFTFSSEGSKGLAFTSNGDGTCYVSGIGTCKDINIVIPAISPAGDVVTGIGNDAFWNCSHPFTSIVIPNSVTWIGDYAFTCCGWLTSVTIGSGVAKLGAWMFSECNRLMSVTFLGSTEKWSALTKDETFWNRFAKVAIVFCTDGDVVVTISSEEAFAFTSNGDGTCYVKAAGRNFNQNFVIPKASTAGDKVTRIGDSAFTNRILTGIVIPNTVKSIGRNAFDGCTFLKNVIIYESVTSIDDLAFANCTALTTINFRGTKAQWQAIVKGENWNRNVPAKVVHCIDGDVAI